MFRNFHTVCLSVSSRYASSPVRHLAKCTRVCWIVFHCLIPVDTLNIRLAMRQRVFWQHVTHAPTNLAYTYHGLILVMWRLLLFLLLLADKWLMNALFFAMHWKEIGSLMYFSLYVLTFFNQTETISIHHATLCYCIVCRVRRGVWCKVFTLHCRPDPWQALSSTFCGITWISSRASFLPIHL